MRVYVSVCLFFVVVNVCLRGVRYVFRLVYVESVCMCKKCVFYAQIRLYVSVYVSLYVSVCDVCVSL